MKKQYVAPEVEILIFEMAPIKLCFYFGTTLFLLQFCEDD